MDATSPSPSPAPVVAEVYELIAWQFPNEAQAAALRALADGLVNVQVVQRRAAGRKTWGFRFQLPPYGKVWVVLDEAGRWLSEERAPSPAAALTIYHATGGSGGTHAVRQGTDPAGASLS
ncbi:MAG TPA: hypothetical protein VIW28_00480 [Gemmatimonadales bacterium]|jgi:hypothetical protein